MEAPVSMQVVDSAGFAPYADTAIDIYAEAMQRPSHVAVQRRAMLARHLTYDGVVAVLAFDADGQLVGFGYGYPGRPGQWWHDSVTRALGEQPAQQVEHWLGDSFEVVELHVRPAYQGQGIGRRLLSTLLAQATQRTTVLSTHDQQSPARRLYRSFGFRDLICDYRFPGGVERFCIMGAELRRPDA